MAAEHATGLLGDTYFWVFLATVGFAALAYKKGKAPLLNMLDARTERIRVELAEAERLRNEAQDILAECQRKHRDALQTSQKIIDNAKETAAAIEKETMSRLAETMKRREEQLIERIARAETAAVSEIRTQAADIATRAAEVLLTDTLAKNGGRLVQEAIEEIPTKFN